MQSSPNESKTLWMGDLESWMDEPYLTTLFNNLGYSKEVASIKLLKDKGTGLPAKYGFIQFNSNEAATNFYQNYNNRTISNTNKSFKLNWAVYGGNPKPNKTVSLQEFSIYVGDLDVSVTEHKLLELFRPKYPSAFMAKIITESASKISKGYGFVKFTNQDEACKAIAEINGTQFYGKIIKVSNAFTKNKEDHPPTEITEETETQIAHRLKLYTQFYSMVNDPLLKAEYEKQIQKTFGMDEGGRKQTLKQSLESVATLSYNQTVKSEDFLNHLPKKIAFKAKSQVEGNIFF